MQLKAFRLPIILVSILLPVAVAVLYVLPMQDWLGGNSHFDFLPKLNAIINGTTFFILIAALIAIKQGKIQWHQNLMTTAIGLSVLFLVSYVIFHATHESTKFGGSLKYQFNSFKFAVNGLYGTFDRSFERNTGPYNQFFFSGKSILNLSADYSWVYKNLNFFGETARSDNGAVATVNGLESVISIGRV